MTRLSLTSSGFVAEDGAAAAAKPQDGHGLGILHEAAREYSNVFKAFAGGGGGALLGARSAMRCRMWAGNTDETCERRTTFALGGAGMGRFAFVIVSWLLVAGGAAAAGTSFSAPYRLTLEWQSNRDARIGDMPAGPRGLLEE
jgi:hypothetical protein